MKLNVTEIPPVKAIRTFNLELTEREALWLVALLGRTGMNELREINSSIRVSHENLFSETELGLHSNSFYHQLTPHFPKK